MRQSSSNKSNRSKFDGNDKANSSNADYEDDYSSAVQMVAPSYQDLKQQELLFKQRERAQRNCRIQINRVANEGQKLDYLTPQRNQRV